MTTMTSMATLAELHALLRARLPQADLVGDGTAVVTRVHTDTRTLQPGDLFVALKGERHDGHDHLGAARAAGAVAVVAEHGLDAATMPGLQVPDTLAALQQLAAGWRARHPIPLVAVTGSNGKTTVTQMVASILRAAHGDAAFATAGNLNNHIGVPLTLLRLRPPHRAGVVELGMNHPGEIALLAALAQPDVVLVNNAQREHLEFMASVEAVARENGSAIAALPSAGVAVFPADDDHAGVWRGLAGGRPQLTFALDAAADLTAEAHWQDDRWAVTLHTPHGDVVLSLAVAGRHNVKNALAAAACALAIGTPLEAVVRGLEAFAPVSGRSQVQPLRLGGRRVTLVDDSYNANPDSMRAAIDVLAGLPGPRWLVMGDMGEVGDRGPEFHAEVGAYAREHGIDVLWAAGTASAEAARAYGPAAHHHGTVDALLADLDRAPPAASIVVKGSRFMRMERVVQALKARAGTGGSA